MAAPQSYGDNLTDLNAYMIPSYEAGLVDAVKEDPKLALLNRIAESGVVEKKKFTAGGKAYIGVKTLRPATGASKAEGADVPRVGKREVTEIYFGTKRVYSVAGLTDEALTNASGFPASYAKLVDDEMADVKLDMRLTLARMLQGDSTGRLGRVASATGTTGAGTVTFDNLRFDFGWAGTAMIRPGMTLEFHAGKSSNGIYIHDSTATTAKVCKFYVASKTATVLTGYAVSGSLGNLADNDIAYVEGTFDNDPNGLLNLIDDGLITSGSAEQGGSQAGVTLFGLNRTAYPFLQARIYRGGENGGTDGTAKTWTLDLLDQVDDAMGDGDGGGQITALYVGSGMARQIRRKGGATAVINTPLGTTAAGRKVVPGVVIDHVLINGREVPILKMSSIPAGVIYAPDEREFRLYERFPMGFKKENGSVWLPSRDRKDNYEAWFRYEYNLACERCDNFARIEDLLENEAT